MQYPTVWQHERDRPEYPEAGMAGATGHGSGYWPLGIKTHMQIPLGMPTLGGPTSTASGLVFFAGTQDYYLRALDSKTGKEV